MDAIRAVDDASDDAADNTAQMKASAGETPRADDTTDNASDDALDDTADDKADKEQLTKISEQRTAGEETRGRRSGRCIGRRSGQEPSDGAMGDNHQGHNSILSKGKL